jgi:outer membrane immunogenic protein
MRTTLVAFAAVSALIIGSAHQARAADIPAPVYKAAPPAVAVGYNWTGFYAGIHGGYGWSDGRTSVGIVDPSGVSQTAAAAGAFPLSYSFDRNGYVAGGQLGFNQQVNQWLWGLETDIAATGIKGSQTVTLPRCPICGGPNLSTVSQEMDWFGTARARLGVVTGQWLIYGTGGLAYGQVKYNYLQTNVPFGGPLTMAGSASKVELGWTAGGGVEYGVGRWSGKVEYLYYDLGDHSFGVPNPLAPPALGVQVVPNFRNTGSIVRAGLNYRFN